MAAKTPDILITDLDTIIAATQFGDFDVFRVVIVHDERDPILVELP